MSRRVKFTVEIYRFISDKHPNDKLYIQEEINQIEEDLCHSALEDTEAYATTKPVVVKVEHVPNEITVLWEKS
jgi:hypothetical protein